MKLKDFVGKHILAGCQFGTMPKKDEWQDSDPNTLDFILDGRLFSVVENPDDGYRSSMDDIIENRESLIITNTFTPCEVFGTFRPNNSYEDFDVVDFFDIVTGKVVMSIGTASVGDYYPSFVGDFTPENMASNVGK